MVTLGRFELPRARSCIVMFHLRNKDKSVGSIIGSVSGDKERGYPSYQGQCNTM